LATTRRNNIPPHMPYATVKSQPINITACTAGAD
jgi:hypothetical protein